MVSCRYVVVSLTLRVPDEYGTESFQYEDKTALTTVSKRMTRKRKLQVADCEQSELNSKWIKEFKSEYVRSCALIMMGV